MLSRKSKTSIGLDHHVGVSVEREISEKVHEAFSDNGYPHLRTVAVHFDHGRVTLQGRVASMYLKQLAQTLALTVDEVREVDNDLKVTSCR